MVMLNKLQRILKHRWMEDASRLLAPAALHRLRSKIATSEALHSGEIRICVESGLPNGYLLRSDSMRALLRQRALAHFGRLGVWDTEANNGVLIYLCLAERAIELVADRGIHRLVPQETWDKLVQHLAVQLKQDQIEIGLLHSVEEVTALLAKHFAVAPGERNPNELPDSVVLR